MEQLLENVYLRIGTFKKIYTFSNSISCIIEKQLNKQYKEVNISASIIIANKFEFDKETKHESFIFLKI